MQLVTFNGAAAYLLDDEPDWSASVQLEAELPVQIERGLTQRLTRQPLAASLRLTLTFTCTLEAAAQRAVRDCLYDLTTQPVLCPFWPYYLAAGGSPAITCDYW